MGYRKPHKHMGKLTTVSFRPSILLTGANGTIGKPLKIFLQQQGFKVFVWDRSYIPIDNYQRMFDFVKSVSPDVFIHLAAITSFDEQQRKDSWLVNYVWPSEIAWICKELNIKLLFISSNMVFGSTGPYSPDSVPDAVSGYGYEKRMAEEKVVTQNANTIILRLGWQIAGEGENSMITYLDRQQSVHSFIKAGKKWYPSCSFLSDTIKVITATTECEPGIYMFNANKDLNFHEIACLLKKRYSKSWNIIEDEDFIADQRMWDERTHFSGMTILSKQDYQTFFDC